MHVPMGEEVALGQAQLPAAWDTGVPSPALAGGTFVTSIEEVASDTMPPSWWEMPLLGPARETGPSPGGHGHSHLHPITHSSHPRQVAQG